jgi:hypothetical protein
MDKATILLAIDLLKEKVNAAPDAASTIAALRKFGDNVAISTVADRESFPDGSSRFLVSSEVFVWARNPRDAAIEARRSQSHPNTMAAVFRVVDRDANATIVDLTAARIKHTDAAQVVRIGAKK